MSDADANRKALAGPWEMKPDGFDPDGPPELQFLTEARVQIHYPALKVGDMSDGNKTIYFIKGGCVRRPFLKGRVIPDAGGDWIKMRPDGIGELDVRFALETDDGAIFHVHWEGRSWCAPEDAEIFDGNRGDTPEIAWKYYFRIAPFFETADPRYTWLNNVVCVTKTRIAHGGPLHRFYVVR